MSQTQLEQFEKRFDELSLMFAKGQLKLASEYFAEPLTIYLEDRLVSSPDRRYLEKMASEFSAYLAAQGAMEIGGKVTNFHESARGFRAIVQARAKFGDVWQDTMQIEYFCRKAGDDFLIEMLVVRNLNDEAIRHLQTTKLATIAEGMLHD